MQEKERQRLSTREANQWLLRYGRNPHYHSGKLDRALGTRYEADLIKTEKGETWLVTDTRYGGFYYFGALLCVIFTAAAGIGLICGLVYAVRIRDWVTFMIEAIVGLPLIAVLLRMFSKSLIKGIREKKEMKKAVREGRKEKEKLTAGAVIYRILLFAFLGVLFFFIAGFALAVFFDIDIFQILGPA